MKFLPLACLLVIGCARGLPPEPPITETVHLADGGVFTHRITDPSQVIEVQRNLRGSHGKEDSGSHPDSESGTELRSKINGKTG